MPEFAANLTLMFNEVPFMERFGAAAQAGFKGVEFLCPYEHDARALTGLCHLQTFSVREGCM